MQGFNQNARLLPGEPTSEAEPIPEAAYRLVEQMFNLDRSDFHLIVGYGVTLQDLLMDPFRVIRIVHQELAELGDVPPGLAALSNLYRAQIESALYKLEQIPRAMH